jgi:glycine cleavage system pyridoxal-binding protein P
VKKSERLIVIYTDAISLTTLLPFPSRNIADMAAANAAAFQGLLARFGFSHEARAAITANGMTSNQDLIGLNDKDIDNNQDRACKSDTPHGSAVHSPEEAYGLDILGK